MKDKGKEALLKSLIEKPTVYELEILDNSMLPTSMIDDKTIKLTIKPPTLEVLAKCALPSLKIPEEIRQSKEIKLEEAVKYRNEIAEVLAILIHGKKEQHPEWMVPFLLNNLSGKELYMLFYESMLKLQTDFFLSCFQIADQNNPMIMSQKKNDLTPTN